MRRRKERFGSNLRGKERDQKRRKGLVSCWTTSFLYVSGRFASCWRRRRRRSEVSSEGRIELSPAREKRIDEREKERERLVCLVGEASR